MNSFRIVLVLLLITLTLGVVICETDQLSICAFNVQVFGKTKFGKTEVVNTLSKIVRRYDVILIQEIRDSSETVIHSFLDVVNSDSEDVMYALNVSERLGRTSSKEQYAFLYRVDKVEVVATHQYEDPTDAFQRPPYSILLTAKTLSIPSFFLTALHSKPSDAFQEINALVPVYNELVQVFQTSKGIILGDLNADCIYLSRTRYTKLDLVTDTRFQWLIESETDTTTNTNDCAYDRIIVTESTSKFVVNGSAKVFRFDEEYGLTLEQTLDVSDHYPVECHLKGESSPQSLMGAIEDLQKAFNSFIRALSMFFNPTV